MPPNISSMARTTVKIIYSRYSLREVSEKCGVILSSVGPGVSRLAIIIPSTPMDGIMAVANTIIPMPPSQWLKERQNRMDFGRASMSLRMDAPVVE